MRDRFHIGQRVIWKTDGHAYTATVISQRERRQFMASGRYALVYGLELDGYGTHGPDGFAYAAPQPELWPIDDRDTPTSWAEFERQCGWAPRVHDAEGIK